VLLNLATSVLRMVVDGLAHIFGLEGAPVGSGITTLLAGSRPGWVR
jgi:hypothetical protein